MPPKNSKIDQRFHMTISKALSILNTDFFDIEFTLLYGIWVLLKQISETNILATPLTGTAWLFNGKTISFISNITRYFRILRFLEVCIA